MMPARSILLALAGASLLTLQACSDDQSASAPPADPDVQERPAEAPVTEERTSTQEALDKIRDAAEATGRAVREEAGKLGERGRQALEDAQPAIDRAGEIAAEIGQSLSAIGQQALREFNEGARRLEERIDERQGEREPFTGDPEALLSPAGELRADTRAAARAQPAGVGPDYVGVWAADAASCGRIDREAVEMIAVITTSTVRRYEAMCNFDPVEMSGDSVVLDASCIAEGDVEDLRIAIDMPSADTLRIGTPEAPGTVDLVRCRLPE
jgi:hypothetical protein